MAKAQWRDKRAILRDLAAVTQGRVAVNISENITADRPPAPNFNDEIDEEHFRHCNGDATFSEGPDLHMIREMISMMQSMDGESKDEAQSIALEITKATPPTPHTKGSTDSLTSSEHRISQHEAEELSLKLAAKITSKPNNIKARRERNVAIASLLKVHAGVAPNGYLTPKEHPVVADVQSPVKLLKPEDFAVTTLNQPTATLNQLTATLNQSTAQLNEPIKQFNESTTQLNESIKQFYETTTQLYESGDQCRETITQLNKYAEQFNESTTHFNGPTKLSNESTTRKQLKRPTKQLYQPTGQLNQPTKQLNQPTKQWNQSTTQLNHTTKQWNQSTTQLNHTTKQLNQPTKQWNQSTTQLNQTTKQLNQSTKQLNQTTKQLNQPPTRLNLPAAQLNQQTNVEKVKQWLKEGEQISRVEPVLSADCFKFKKSHKMPANPIEKAKSVKAASPKTSQHSGDGKYVPSPYAQELYNTILQKKETAQRIREDVWARAEREMKELDAKRALEEKIDEEINCVVQSLKEEALAKEPVTVCLDDGSEIQIPLELCLPQHRHKLTGDCTVCVTMATFEERKNRLSILETESQELANEISDEHLGNKDVIATHSNGTEPLEQETTVNEIAVNEQKCDIEKSKEPSVKVEKVEDKLENIAEIAMKLTDSYDVPDFWEDLLEAPEV